MRDRRAGGFARGQVGRCAGPWDGAHDGPRAWAGSRLCVGGLPFVSLAVAVRRLPRLDDAQCAGSQRGPRQWQCSHRGRCQREAARCERAHRLASHLPLGPLAVRAPSVRVLLPGWQPSVRVGGLPLGPLPVRRLALRAGRRLRGLPLRLVAVGALRTGTAPTFEGTVPVRSSKKSTATRDLLLHRLSSLAP